MATRYEPKELQPIFVEMDGASARAAINVGGALLEYALEKALEANLRPASTNDEKNALFSENGLLGTFSQKIWTAYFIRLLGPMTRRDLDLVRSVRNVVAHNMNPVDFTSEGIGDRCGHLHHVKDALVKRGDPRETFLATVHVLAGALLLKAGLASLEDEEQEAAQLLLRYLDE